MLGWYALVALVVSHEAIKDGIRAVARWVEPATGVVLVGLGIKLVFSRTSS